MKVTTFNKKTKRMICEDLLIIDLRKFYNGTYETYFYNFHVLYILFISSKYSVNNYELNINFYNSIDSNIKNKRANELIYILNQYKNINFLRELVSDESILDETKEYLKIEPKDHYVKTIDLFYAIRSYLREIDLLEKLEVKEETTKVRIKI